MNMVHFPTLRWFSELITFFLSKAKTISYMGDISILISDLCFDLELFFNKRNVQKEEKYAYGFHRFRKSLRQGIERFDLVSFK